MVNGRMSELRLLAREMETGGVLSAIRRFNKETYHILERLGSRGRASLGPHSDLLSWVHDLCGDRVIDRVMRSGVMPQAAEPEMALAAAVHARALVSVADLQGSAAESAVVNSRGSRLSFEELNTPRGWRRYFRWAHDEAALRMAESVST